MSTPRTRRRRPHRGPSGSVGKPRGVLHPRVQQVGPEHFGIVCVDCAKARSKFLLADFYGRVLIPPTTVAHNRPELVAAAGFETRILHPFVTKQYRQGVDPGDKTDDTDLAAIQRATVTGCALLEATRDEAWTSLQLLT